MTHDEIVDLRRALDLASQLDRPFRYVFSAGDGAHLPALVVDRERVDGATVARLRRQGPIAQGRLKVVKGKLVFKAEGDAPEGFPEVLAEAWGDEVPLLKSAKLAAG